MTKIKSINPNQLYIAQNVEVLLKLAGNTAQVTFTAGKNNNKGIAVIFGSVSGMTIGTFSGGKFVESFSTS